MYVSVATECMRFNARININTNADLDALECIALAEYLQARNDMCTCAVQNPPTSLKKITWDRPGIKHDIAIV
jgi:hypothetical protein